MIQVDTVFLPGTSGEPEPAPAWAPHEDWWDIKEMVDTGVLEWSGASVANVRYGFLLADSYATTMLLSGYEYYLSDGSHYATLAANTWHTWDRAKDKDCAEGYKTRAVIVCGASRDVAILHKSHASGGCMSMYIYLGDCNLTSINAAGNTTAINANRALRAVRHGENTTATATSIGSYAFCNCTGLVLFEVPSGPVNIGMNAFASCVSLTTFNNLSTGTANWYSIFDGCTSLPSIIIPNGVMNFNGSTFYNNYSLRTVTVLGNLTSIPSTTFSNCHGITSFNVPKGFKASVALASSLLLSASSLEQMIENAATRIPKTEITFTIGEVNIAKISAYHKQLAADNLITLA